MSLTAGQVIEAAQNHLNAVSDTLWSSAELLKALYLCELELALRSKCIYSTSTDTSVASTATYTKPTTAFEIWRVTYNGNKLQKIDRRDSDVLNYNNTTTPTGTPYWYTVEGTTVTLFPTPDTSALTIQYFFYAEPTEATTTASTLTTPTQYQYGLVDMLTARMCPKDLGHPLTTFFMQRSEVFVERVTQLEKRRKRGDRFAVVKTEENTLNSEFGII
jgi:hypothetical protein